MSISRRRRPIVKIVSVALIAAGLIVGVMAQATEATPEKTKSSSEFSSLPPTITPALAYATYAPTFSPTARQARPMYLGVSGGNITDKTTTSCFGGTLGGLLKKSSSYYILSNNHVLAKSNLARSGDDIVQPGLIDNGCTQVTGDAVADLTSFVKIAFKSSKATPLNKVDAAVALVRTGQVRTDGAINGIGPVSNLVAYDRVGCAVKKSGRSTGVTSGTITAIDATVDVTYSGGKVARYVDQFIVGSGFSAAGDSGSLVVRDGINTATPRVVGLLFAGNSSISIVNPITNVLAALTGYTIAGVDDGKSSDCPVQSVTSSSGSFSAGTTSGSQDVSGNIDRLEKARAAKARHEERFMGMKSVVGMAVGSDGTIDILMSQDDSETKAQIPATLDDVPSRVMVVGEILAR